MANERLRPVLNPQLIKDDARFGELGMIPNPDGRISTEFSVTEFVPELGGWVNIPSLVQGQTNVPELLKGNVTEQHVNRAIRRAMMRVKEGAKLPSFKTLDEALKVAQGRSIEEKNRPFELNAIME